MVDFSNQVDVPLDSTNQLGDFEDWINRPNEYLAKYSYSISYCYNVNF